MEFQLIANDDKMISWAFFETPSELPYSVRNNTLSVKKYNSRLAIYCKDNEYTKKRLQTR